MVPYVICINDKELIEIIPCSCVESTMGQLIMVVH